MGTRSFIGEQRPDGTVRAVYCHWDGYPSYVGKMLRDAYTESAKVSALLDLGDLSSLGPEPGERHDFNDRSHPEWCTAYGRDRGETGVDPTSVQGVEDFIRVGGQRGCDWVYLWQGDRWRCWSIVGDVSEFDLHSRDSPIWNA